MSKTIKDKLFAYQGGGYDGCFWEWNFLMFDADGEFHDIHSSGHAGITEAEHALDAITACIAETDYTDAFVADINDAEKMAEFDKEFNPQHVVGVMAQINEIYGDDKVSARCDDCGCKIDKDDARYVKHTSDHVSNRCSGPITPKGKLCHECFNSGACDMCRENGEDDDSAYFGENLDDNQLCWFHHDFVILTLLEDNRIRKTAEAMETEELAEILELWGAIVKGESQLEDYMRSGVSVKAMKNNSHAHSVNVSTLQGRIVDLWKEIPDAERKALYRDHNEQFHYEVEQRNQQPLRPVPE